jgi:hypothetical protein
VTRTEREHAVGVIPPGAPFTAAGDLLRGFGRCYPEHALRLSTDTLTGGWLIIFDPAAPAPSAPAKTGEADADPASEPEALGMTISLGIEEQADLLSMALEAEDGDQATGVKVLGGLMRNMLDQGGAANYLTHTLDYTDGKRYALTIQRVDGLTPAEKIAALQAEKADLEAALTQAREAYESLEGEYEEMANQ